MTPVERVRGRLRGVSADGKSARCPAHDDRRASLSIDEGDDGQALLHCHAGCTADAILAALNLKRRDLFPRAGANGGRRLVEVYDYRDERGELLYQAVRYEPKDFRQRHPDGKGGS